MPADSEKKAIPEMKEAVPFQDTAESSDHEEQQGRFSLLFPSIFLFFVRSSRSKLKKSHGSID
jgi:hypothetical protein